MVELRLELRGFEPLTLAGRWPPACLLAVAGRAGLTDGEIAPRLPSLLVGMEIDGSRRSSKPNRERITEPPDGVVPAVRDMSLLQPGQMRGLLREEEGDQAGVDIYFCAAPLGHCYFVLRVARPFRWFWR